MSRTLHVDLTPARRSKRLLKNGYYVQPSGETLQHNESSEDDDDSASVHSNSSSLFSERAVHYNESPTAVFSHKRRRRKGMESPGQRNLLQPAQQVTSHSPLVSKKQSLLHVTGNVSRSTPNLSMSKGEKSSRSLKQTTRETKTTITSIQQTSHRYARGESSTVAHSSLTSSQASSHNSTRGNNDQWSNVVTRNQSHYSGIGGGDQMINVEDSQLVQASQPYLTPNARVTDEFGDSTVETATNNISRRRKIQTQYSSESDGEGVEITKSQDVHLEAAVPLLLTTISHTARSFIFWITSILGAICRSIYQATLSVFVFDVRWLSKRTSPVFAKIAKYIFLLLLLLLLLATVYLFAARLVSERSQTALLPVQSIVGLYQFISQKITSFTLYSDHAAVTHTPISEGVTDSQSKMVLQNFEAELVKTQLNVADKLAEIKKEISKMRQEQQEFNKKQEKLSVSNEETMTKLLSLKNEIEAIQLSGSQSTDGVKSDIAELRAMLTDRSHMSVKISEFSNKLATFDARLNTLNDLIMNSVKNFDQHVGNTTYIKEIAKMQFIESFLNVLKTTEGSSDAKDKLHFLFIAWLNKQGFAKVEEVDKNMKQLAEAHNISITALERKFATQFERIRHEARRHTSTITLEKIVERPLKQDTEVLNVGMEADVRRWIQDELAVYSADRIAIADHALESAGGFIVSTRCSESYNKKTALVSLFGIPIYYNINTPRSVIQASTLPGECWSFKGSQGYVVIALSGAVRPTSFTLDHIPRELSPHRRIDSAPKDFKVLGLADMYDYEGVELGEFRYEQDGPVIQQFSVTSDNKDYFTHVELRVMSNWGHPEYTCLYRFRVHGDRQAIEPPPM